MKNIIKYAPLITAVAWAVCLIVSIIRPGSYRFEFAVAAGVLVLMNVYCFWSDRNDREIKRPNDKS